LNDKYRILAVVHGVIESLRPGAALLPFAGQFQQNAERGHAKHMMHGQRRGARPALAVTTG